MDDEMPLTALAAKTVKKSSFDDDMPLARLATPGGVKARPLARPSTSSQVPKAGTAKGKTRKREESSSSSSSSDTYSTSSSDSGDKKARMKKARTRLLAKKRAQQEDDGADNAIKKKDRTPKEQVVVDLLCRWWYAMDDWPPNDPKYYEDELAKRNLRRVSVQEWEWVADTDDKGRSKVYELSQFKGIFRRADGEKVDLRPMETCPSYTNFMKKDLPELYSLLVKAYENQIKDLVNSKYDEAALRETLTTGLSKIREKSQQASQMSYATGATAKKLQLR